VEQEVGGSSPPNCTSRNQHLTSKSRNIEGLVSRKVPVIEDFDGFLKVLNPSLQVRPYVLVLLYERGKAGASFAELEKWVRPTMRGNLRRTLSSMVDAAVIHENDAGTFILTKLGRQEVETRNLHNE
jgi:hypothetical protein